MLRSVGKQNLLKNITNRKYSAQATLKPSAGDYYVDVTSKHVKVICAQPNNPIAKISFSFKAGSRYEPEDKLGVRHILRKAIGLSTAENYPFLIFTVPAYFNGSQQRQTTKDAGQIAGLEGPADDLKDGDAKGPADNPKDHVQNPKFASMTREDLLVYIGKLETSLVSKI